MESAYLACFAELAAAEKAVVLTGAGVSTLSGIPDFRVPFSRHRAFLQSRGGVSGVAGERMRFFS